LGEGDALKAAKVGAGGEALEVAGAAGEILAVKVFVVAGTETFVEAAEGSLASAADEALEVAKALAAVKVEAAGKILAVKVCVATAADEILDAGKVWAAGETVAIKLCVATAAGEIVAAKVCVATAAGEIVAAKVCVATAAGEIVAAKVCIATAAGEIVACVAAPGVTTAADTPERGEACVADAAVPFDKDCGAFDELVAS
jgi:hypothetical protein